MIWGFVIQSYKIALQVYTGKEFRESLKALMEKGEVIIVGRGYKVRHAESGSSRNGSFVFEKVSTFSPEVPFEKRGLCLNTEGHPVDPEKEEGFCLTRILLYVPADGLPKKVIQFLSPICGVQKTMAQEIIESMQRT